MKLIYGDRGSGKTTELIKIAHERGLYIVCFDERRAMQISRLARSLEMDIRYPITVDELPLQRGVFIKEVLVDDMEDVLARMLRKNISAATITKEDEG
ncbi:replicase domain protein [Fictibacillus macauensis ZFHKF-1]|uniref:Replicase domain protein n=1 Tax=Fictibacillus macauensis ZFHKF-1 TaxID=1196324 RepID=I8J2G2_9BACL|nr:hypothetical protein [Fictibacillus macauensis]EIT85931.1 replicase domain protein [Fictibacillus macauensis ZFHKF-1]